MSGPRPAPSGPCPIRGRARTVRPVRPGPRPPRVVSVMTRGHIADTVDRGPGRPRRTETSPMAYPRACLLCGADYRSDVAELGHVTPAAEDGGTPSPWRPALPGRTLTLRCTPCGESYRWD